MWKSRQLEPCWIVGATTEIKRIYEPPVKQEQLDSRVMKVDNGDGGAWQVQCKSGYSFWAHWWDQCQYSILSTNDDVKFVTDSPWQRTWTNNRRVKSHKKTSRRARGEESNWLRPLVQLASQTSDKKLEDEGRRKGYKFREYKFRGPLYRLSI
ncbi:hypothetical protein Pmani_027538 [Petrolisthes manimaculis]|uniref:Uncharacterized protein n=1 Tax=Petrolisthes manimaculis TaxID=1843537 RepID=A0AAE1P3V5_9EUCA|nr:hypothetical protein Pmani_027538 [Petrolisthes manimaculis]